MQHQRKSNETKLSQCQTKSSNVLNNFIVNLTICPLIIDLSINHKQLKLINSAKSINDDKNNNQSNIDNKSSISINQKNLEQTKTITRLPLSDFKNDGQINNLKLLKNRAGKSWGNFINYYDNQGRQCLAINVKQLTNYFVLNNFDQPNSPFRFYASLFANGNYPKPLYSYHECWRMRYNIFASGICGTDSKQGSEILNNIVIDNNQIYHIGELHLYLVVKRNNYSTLDNKSQSVYQNLYFFFNDLLKEVTEPTLKQSLIDCANQLRLELSCSTFIEQLLFPVERERFNMVDQTVDYFMLRQQDLAATIMINKYGYDDNLQWLIYRPKKFEKILTNDDAISDRKTKNSI